MTNEQIINEFKTQYHLEVLQPNNIYLPFLWRNFVFKQKISETQKSELYLINILKSN